MNNKNKLKKKRYFLLTYLIILLIALIMGFLAYNIAKDNNLQKGQITGQTYSGVISIMILPRCIANIGNGWVFFSPCANTTNNSIDEIFNNKDYRYILKWNVSKMEWDIFSPRAIENPFESIDLNNSYFILAYTNDTISIIGNESQDMEINLVEGWNAPSWPYLFSTNVTKYVNESKHRYLLKWNASLQEFLIFSPRAIENEFTTIEKAEGQMLYSYFSDTLVYNKTYLR